ncbi:MAG: hypothetical protein JRN66_08910 [Nitrososphaerota archaeon]|nr:hypothetical protein [Nitrososphaerota archaeon]
MSMQSVGSGEMTFITKEEVIEYLNKLLSKYEEITKTFSELAGEIMRDKKQSGVKVTVGTLRVSEFAGRAEYLLQIVEDMKIKIGKIRDMLREIENTKGGVIPQATKYILCLREGVPTRLILDNTFIAKNKFRLETRLMVKAHY